MIKNYSLVLIAFLCFVGMGFSQPWAYDFGTSTGTFNTAGASTTFLPQPPLGGGEDRIRIGSGAGSWNMENQIISFGNQSYLRGVAATGTSVNKFSIYDYDAGETFTLKFDMLLGNSTGGNTVNSGEWDFFVGDGADFSGNGGFTGSQTFLGIQLKFGSGGTITTNYRNGSSWTSMPGTPFSQGNSYSIEIYGNNSTGDLTYNNGSCQSVATNTFDLWVNGILIGNDLSKADINDNENIDSFMFNGISSSFNAANIFLDNFEYSNSLPVSTDEVDFCNVDFPENGSILVGGSYDVYAQAYEPGVTNSDFINPGTGIQAWIGYSSIDATSTSDFTSPNWTWVNASYINDVGNNDQYRGTFGSTLPSGRYYYVSRFQLNCGPFVYGGKTPNTLNGGGIWDNTNYVSGVLTIDQVDFCNLQSPSTHTMELCDNFEVYGQVYEPGVTDIANNQGAGIVAEVGYSTSNTHPNTWTNWIPTTYNTNCTGGNNCNSNQNDEYYANLGAEITAPGTYYYAMRYTLNSGAYSYGGILADGSAGNFWDGTTYISGVLTVNATEIDVERNTGASIVSSTCTTNPANTGNNTLFAATSIGNTTAPKIYYIHNEGNSDLTITSITLNSGLDFNILNAPSLPITINPGDSVSFEIEFAPNSVGSLEDTITIVSNDCDESIYTFCIGGTGLCAATSLTINPESGPVGTVITITGQDFGGMTTASLNGLSANPVTVISSTEIEVTVPTGAVTGSIEVINDSGCVSSELFTVIDSFISGCEGSSSMTPTELFISEVTDHVTGSHSYVEIFNGTGSTVNLTGYEIRVHNNGASTATNTVALSGSIVNGDVFVLAFGSINATDFHATHGYDQSSSISGINEDDNIRLYNGAIWVDLWGDTSGSTFTVAPKDYTYRRKNSGIIAPSTTWNFSDWNAFSPVDYSDIGTYDFSTGVPPSITVQPTAPSSSCNLSATISVTATEGFVGGNSLAYQWYYNIPGTNSWAEVVDGAIYSGANTAALTISNTFGLNNYQYYCEVREDDATCYQASNAVRLTVDVVTWDGSTWSNGTGPDINTIAIIDGNYNTSAGINNQISFSACNLIVNSGTLTIANSNFVEVANDVSVNVGAIQVNTQGAFIQQGIGSAAGSFTLNGGTSQVSKFTAPLANWYDYTYWSSPVANELVSNALAFANPNRRFWFNANNYLDLNNDNIDDDANDWTLVGGISDPYNSMTAGRGYAATHNTIGFIPNTSYQYIFEGALNTGDISYPLSYNNANTDHWNLIGNPYPCALDINELFSVNSGVIKQVAYVWSHYRAPLATNPGNEVLNFNQSDYLTFNASGELGNGSDLDGDGDIDSNDIPERYIASGQGFFVSSLANSNIVFNNDMRISGENSNLQFFRQQIENDSPERFWINLNSDNGAYSQLLIAYLDGASDNNDGSAYDAKRLTTDNASSIYSLIESEPESKFSIQAKNTNSLSLEEVIPIGFNTNIQSSTIYTLKLLKISGDFISTNDIYIHDIYLQLYHNLSESDYNFTSEPGEFNDRFEIVFQTTALSTEDTILSANDLTIIELPDGSVKFKVGKNHAISQVEIIDLLGRTLYTLKGTGSEEIYFLPQLSQSAYIAKVTLNNGQTLSKKAIKKN